MYPEDRVLVAYLPAPADFEIILNEGWYRIPEKHAPKGLHAEYYAFYFGQKFGANKWSIHYYAQQLGYELVTRLDLLPEESDHPRANERYFKISLGPLIQLQQPIHSLRWRRITFIHTTWDRFQDAQEINDLFVEGGKYVDRLYYALKERGIQLEFDFNVHENGPDYDPTITVPCKNGQVRINWRHFEHDALSPEEMAAMVLKEITDLGGQRLP
jgi:hypothetical protein